MRWQKILASGFTNSHDLLAFLELPSDLTPSTTIPFKTRVPREFAALIEKGNPTDPLLLQVLAQQTELEHNPLYSIDPLKESEFTPTAGLIHKYSTRVLLTFSPTCAINCRFCFRRHFPYAKNRITKKSLAQALEYISQHPMLNEVILSGGDPLLSTDESFYYLLNQLQTIAHIKTLRLHSRVPIVLPQRITQNWLKLFKNTTLHKVMVVHTNHPNELTEQTRQVFAALKSANFHLLNQSVLLKNINDNADVLVNLSWKLFDQSVLPYYLHLLDKVQGTQHFAVTEKKAKVIYQELQKKLSGYLLPKLVKEDPDKGHKTLY